MILDGLSWDQAWLPLRWKRKDNRYNRQMGLSTQIFPQHHITNINSSKVIKLTFLHQVSFFFFTQTFSELGSSSPWHTVDIQYQLFFAKSYKPPALSCSKTDVNICRKKEKRLLRYLLSFPTLEKLLPAAYLASTHQLFSYFFLCFLVLFSHLCMQSTNIKSSFYQTR